MQQNRRRTSVSEVRGIGELSGVERGPQSQYTSNKCTVRFDDDLTLDGVWQHGWDQSMNNECQKWMYKDYATQEDSCYTLDEV